MLAISQAKTNEWTSTCDFAREKFARWMTSQKHFDAFCVRMDLPKIFLNVLFCLPGPGENMFEGFCFCMHGPVENIFDYIIIAILLLSIVIALLRGFIREAASLVTWILGIVLGVSFAPALSQYIAWTGSVPVKYICAFFAVFLLKFVIYVLSY